MPSVSEQLIDDICSPEPARVSVALQAAAPQRETLAPVLLARLLQAAAQPQKWTGIKEQPSPIFLPYLAAAWKLADAHALLVALLRLPPDDCNAMLGDFITEGARLTLADTWPGDLRAIEALALDERAEPFARGAGLGAAALRCARKLLPREDVVALLSRCAALPLDPDQENDSIFAGQIVSTVLDLQAWELRGTVTALFERELVDPFFCGDLDAVLADLKPGAAFTPDAGRFPPPITDAWEAVRGWCFFAGLLPGRRPWAAPRASEAAAAGPRPEPPAREAGLPAEPWSEPKPYRAPPKTGRNDPCPCGSGKKYKKCCGA